MAADLEYRNGDNWGQIFRKILQNLYLVAVSFTGGGGSSLSGATASQPNAVTVGGNDVSILAANADRRGFELQNDGGADVLITLGAAAVSGAFRLTPGGVYNWDKAYPYKGAIRGTWNGSTSTSVRVLELT